MKFQIQKETWKSSSQTIEKFSGMRKEIESRDIVKSCSAQKSKDYREKLKFIERRRYKIVKKPQAA